LYFTALSARFRVFAGLLGATWVECERRQPPSSRPQSQAPPQARVAGRRADLDDVLRTCGFRRHAKHAAVLGVNGQVKLSVCGHPVQHREDFGLRRRTRSRTLAFSNGEHENLFNFGGGVDYWMKKRVGLRIEFRDQVWSGPSQTSHFWGARFGVTVR
jgi:hypothetical protein